VIVASNITNNLSHDDFNAGGIKFNNVVFGSISNNIAKHTSGPGIELLGTKDVSVTGNYLDYNAQHGIRFQVAAFRNTDIKISDNVITNFRPNGSGCIINANEQLIEEDNITIRVGAAYYNLATDFSDTCYALVLK
jgi:hypothetical protein